MVKCRNCNIVINDAIRIILKGGYTLKQCKPCAAIEKKEWKIKNKEHCAEKDREWKKVNRDRHLESLKKCYIEYKNDPEFIAKRKAYNAHHYRENKQQHLNTTKVYTANNKEKVREYRRTYDKDRRINDLNFKISKNLRSRLSHAIRKNHKSGSAIKNLGCSIDFLKKHLELQFSPGMTWDNYGTWEIDHMIALSTVDLSDKEQLALVCHYSNLQPLWKRDNILKGNRQDTEL